ncbi:MAG TPA: FAD binding domain-containing protein [Myxococcota bacterium]|jgi:CO/xanthine dehydrogenase FAD-binding subunit|nr:FAD binding domain-containing protein [Myxococcota bacterium]
MSDGSAPTRAPGTGTGAAPATVTAPALAAAAGLVTHGETAVHAPRTLAEALAVKAEHGAACTVVAGGTDLMVGARPGVRRFSRVLDLWRVAELRGVSTDEHGALVLGATTTFAEIIRSPVVASAAPALVAAARTIGAEQIQARATIGGNVVNASPAADSVPVLSACDAQLVIASAAGGERTVALHDFYLGYKKLDLAPGELLVRVVLPAHPFTWMAFRKVGTRAAQSIAKVAVAGRAWVVDGKIQDVALAYASVAPTVVRARLAEKLLLSYDVTQLPVAQVRRALASDLRPIDDVRSTADYRRRVAANVTARLLQELAATAGAAAPAAGGR